MQGHWSYFCTLPTATLYSITTEYILAGEKFWKLTWKGYFIEFIIVWSYVYMIDQPLFIDYHMQNVTWTNLMLITDYRSLR